MKKNQPMPHPFIGLFLAALFLLTPPAYSELTNIELLNRPIALKGTIVTPSQVIQNGWVLIENHKISGIYNSTTRLLFPAKTIKVDTKGIIFPGLVDVHNHISWNIFQPWSPGRLKFKNRYEWRYHSPEFKEKVATPYDNLNYCDSNMYGELVALTGGTTSVVNGKPGEDCTKGLTRDLGDPEQVNQRRIENQIFIQNHNPTGSDNSINTDVKNARIKLESGNLDAFFVHLAEGKATDQVTKQEFLILQHKGLLTPKTAIVHGISFGPAEFDAMYQAGSSLVWSPRSNIALYGQTADIVAAKRKMVRIALAPDWAISGSRNLLEELHYADQWNKQHLGNLLTDKDLAEMVTIIPAAIAGLSDKVGSIKKGLFADLLVISGDPTQPYRSLVKAGTADVKLVLVNGSPIYGERDLMEKFWNAKQLEVLLNTSPAKVLKLPFNHSIGSVKQLENNLRNAMDAQDVKLAPLFPIEIKYPDNLKLDK